MTDTQEDPRPWLSQSLAYLWNRCHYNFGVAELLGIVPRYTPAPLRGGTLVHAGFEHALKSYFARESDPIDRGCTAIHAEQMEWLSSEALAPHIDEDMRTFAEQQCDLAIKVFERAFRWLGVLDGRWEILTIDGVPLIEFPMREPWGPDGYWAGLQGTLDLVARETDNGNAWLIDIKSRKNMMKPDYDEAQTQAPGYQHLLRVRHGIELSGTATLQVRRDEMTVPHQNKTKPKGATKYPMSRSQVKCDWPTYRKALLDAGLDPDDYADVQAKLKPWDSFDTVFRSPTEVAKVYEMLVQTAGEMAREIQRLPPFDPKSTLHLPLARNLNPFNCKGCSNKTWCLADLRDHDLDFLSKTEYMREGEQPFFGVELEDEDAESWEGDS
jgi:hypothetical protein